METNPNNWPNAPVVEVVLGIQFDPIERFSNGHLGMFWQRIRADYPEVDDAPALGPVIDNFDDPAGFTITGLAFGQHRGESRLRMSQTVGPWMVQLQNGWLIVNWIKREGHEYKGYSEVQSEFDRVYGLLQAFVDELQLGPINPNLWEVTYIDHVQQGRLWSKRSDVKSVFPGLVGYIGTPSELVSFEGINGTWSFGLKELKGRLTVQVQSARTDRGEVISVTSRARGPLTPEEIPNLSEKVKAAKKATVATFEAVISPEARDYWRGATA